MACGMTRQPCEVCGKEDLIPFTCSYCGKVFCAEHHLPEKHDCASLPTTSPPYVVEKLEYTRLKKAAEEIRPITPFVPPRKQQKSKAKVLAILVLFIGIMAAFTVSNTVGLSPLTVFNTLDLSPPIIQIISPRMTTYNIGAISLTYMVNEPILGWVIA
jgi:hypothetical protein